LRTLRGQVIVENRQYVGSPGTAGSSRATRGERMFDPLISGRQIVDGTGNVGFYGAVAVDRESVHILRGDVSDVEATRVIDASGAFAPYLTSVADVTNAMAATHGREPDPFVSARRRPSITVW
jgi:hypothetical protein